MRRVRILFWNGEEGVAVRDNHHTPLPRKPRVMDLDIDQIDYMLGVIGPGTHWVRVVGDGPEGRDLTREERDYIDAALDRMVHAGVNEIC